MKKEKNMEKGKINMAKRRRIKEIKKTNKETVGMRTLICKVKGKW